MKSTFLLLSLVLFSSAQPMLVKKVKNPFDWNHKKFTYNPKQCFIAAMGKDFYETFSLVINHHDKTTTDLAYYSDAKLAFNKSGSDLFVTQDGTNNFQVYNKNMDTKKTTLLLNLQHNNFTNAQQY